MTGGLALVLAFVGCSHSGSDAPTGVAEKSAEPESRVKHDTNGAVIITLDAATQKVMGLQVAPLAAADLAPEIKGVGRVLDPVTLSSAVEEYVTSGWTADTSLKDYERLKLLAESNNASARAVETANAAMIRDAAQARVALARLRAMTSKQIAGRPELSAFAQSLATGDRALVRIDLPAGDTLKTDPKGARLIKVTDGDVVFQGSYAGEASSADPNTLGRGFLFLVETNANRLTANAAVTGYLQFVGETQSGVTVPRSAVVRYNGATWVYVQSGDETFARSEMACDRPVDAGWFVASGLKADAKVVIAGAQQLLSEELKGQGGGD
jgi:hypothetical protein